MKICKRCGKKKSNEESYKIIWVAVKKDIRYVQVV